MTTDELNRLHANTPITVAGLATCAGINIRTYRAYLDGQRGKKGLPDRVQCKLRDAMDSIGKELKRCGG